MAEMTRREKREAARLLFLTGECDSNAKIARKLRMKNQTVARYRREEKWDDLRLKVDRQSAEKMVESLAGERTNLNLRHYKYWDAVLVQAGEALKSSTDYPIRDLERISHIIDRAQRGQRLARGLSISGQTEEQIKAQAAAEGRALVDTFIEAIKAHVPDEGARDKVRLAILDHLPRLDGAGAVTEGDGE